MKLPIRRSTIYRLLGLLSSTLGACTIPVGGHMELAYEVSHTIASPRVPFYRYDASRVIEIRYTSAGNTYEAYWLVDRDRGIDRPLTHEPEDACSRFGSTGWHLMFNTFEDGKSPATALLPHFASDDPELLLFAEAIPREFTWPERAKSDLYRTALELSTLVSHDGGRHFALRNIVLNPPPALAPRTESGAQYADYSDIPVRVSKFSKLHFLIVRNGVAYIGLGNVVVSEGASYAESIVYHMGKPIAVFAFDPRDTTDLLRARLLQGAALRQFALPEFDAGTHRMDKALLDRVNPPINSGTDEATRRAYIESLRKDFPEWAAQQHAAIGRRRFQTTDERSRMIDKATAKGDPCAGWVPY